MTDGRTDPTLVGRYEALIASGVYQTSTVHGGPDRAMVERILRGVLAARPAGPLRVLDMGCGPGEWLLLIAAVAKEQGVTDLRLRGIDVTPGMIDLARRRLAEAGLDATLGGGDILDRSTYGDADEAFDLVFSFDVVQQLPRGVQYVAAQTLCSALAPGGVATIFDHDRETRFGRSMGLKKWLTRHGPYPFVPRWYIHAAYPPLARFARALAAAGFEATTEGAPDTPRRVLIARRPAA